MGVFSRFRRRRTDAATEEAAEVRAEGSSPADSAGPADDAEGGGAVQAAEASSEAVGTPEDSAAEPAEVSGETDTADEPGTDGATGPAAAGAEIPRQQSVSDSETDKGARK